jgi:sugar transferase (PEP-CTERM/EpsH1 system associated)
MRILWVCHFVPYPPTGHGTLQRTHHLLRNACRRHEVHLVALSPPWVLNGPGEVEQAVAELSSFTASVAAFPLPTLRHYARRAFSAATSFVTPASFWERSYGWRPMLRHLNHVARTTCFDLVHVETILIARYLDAVPRLPIVLSHHNIESQLLESRATAEHVRWRRLFFRREARKIGALERSLVPRVAHNIVVSDLDAQRLREVAGAAKITTVTNGVDTDFFRPSASATPNTKSLVFAGGMNWFPNHDAMTYFASEVWPALIQDDPERTMTVVGRDPPGALREAAHDRRLRVLGYVDDVRPYVESAAIYLCPIRVGGGTRLKILDALSMSRPLVSTDLGVEGLGLEEGKHYLRANSPAEFVGQVRRLEGDAALRRQLGEAGRSFVVQRYSWHRVAEPLEQAYTEVVGAA